MSLLIPALTSRSFKEAFFADTPADAEKAEAEKKDEAPKGWTMGSIIQMILGVLIGVYAATLSWSCNSKLEYSTLAKIIFSFFAFIFGGLYLILYVILRMDACARIPEPVPAVAAY